jgi:hypothetical protein
MIRKERQGVCVTRRHLPKGSVVLITLKLEPTLMVPEMSGTQASLINSLSDHA